MDKWPERCPCDCKSLPPFTLEEAERVISYLGEDAFVDVPVFMGEVGPSSPKEEQDRVYSAALQAMLVEGMNKEREHCDITRGDPLQTAKIALAHLKEDTEYYTKLKKTGL